MKSVRLVACKSFASAAGVFKEGVDYPVSDAVYASVMAEKTEVGIPYFEDATGEVGLAQLVGLGPEDSTDPVLPEGDAGDGTGELPKEVPVVEAPAKKVSIGKGRTVTV